jgi:ribonuclease J
LVLDGDTIIAADGETLSQRRRMSWYGVISIAVALDGDNNLLGDPVIRLLGLPIEADVDDFLAEASAAAENAVKDWRGDLSDLRENLRLAVRRVATSWTGKKPIVEVLIVETA